MSPMSRSAIKEALRLSQEAKAFAEQWPTPAGQDDPLPQLSWSQVERQLADLALTPAKKEMATALISATRKQARFKPAELVMREILCIAGVLMDESFDPQSREGAMS